MNPVLKLAGHPHIRQAHLTPEAIAEIERDERIVAAQERREERVDAKREREEEFDFERDCGAKP